MPCTINDEKVRDGKVIEQLVEQVLENKNIKIKSVLTDDREYGDVRILNIFKRKGLGLQSRLERIPLFHSKTIRYEIEKLDFKQKICLN
jgi:hypothetical protein